MHVRQLPLFVCALLLLAPLPAIESRAKPAQAKPEYSYWPHDASDLKPDPAVRYGVLKNGLRYAVMRNTQPAGTISLRLRVAAGSLQETEDQRGLAHFMEHMAFNGSKNVPEGEYVKLLQRKGLAFGAHTNAYTSTNETVYQLELPKNDADLIETGLMLFREIGDRLTISAAAVEREKGVVLSELRTRNTPEYRAFEARWKLMFEGQRQADRMPIGTEKTIKGATRELLADYYARYYRPERTMIIATGDFDPAQMEKRIQAKFSDWVAQGGPSADPDLGTVKQRPLTAASFVEPNLPEDASVSWFNPPEDLTDTKVNRKLNAQRGLALEVVNRRLERIARGAKPPFLSASVSRSETRGAQRALTVSVDARPGQWRAALAAAEQELRRAVVHGFHASEIDRELKGWRTGLEDAVAKAGTRKTAGLANAIAGDFEARGVFTHPRDDLALFEASAKEYTAASAHAALKDLVRGQGPVVFVSSGQAIEGGDKAIATAYGTSVKTAVAASEEAKRKDFPYADFGKPGEVKSRARIADLDVATMRFANGVKLNVKQTNFEKDTIYISARYAGGYIHMPRDKVGLDWALPFGFIEGGLKKLTTDELEESLAGHIVATNLDMDEESFEFAGRTNTKDLGLQLQLMAAYATDPAYRGEGVARMQDAAESFIKQYGSSPGRVLSREAPSILRSGDKRWAFPSLENMRAITVGDVETTMKRVLDEAPIEVTIVGDVKPEVAAAAVAKTFGALKPRKEKLAEQADARTVRFPAASVKHSFTHEGRPDQATAYVAWAAPDFYSSPRRARAIALMREMLEVRLVDEFREAQGATYSPSVGSWHSGALSDFGYISASAETRPDLVDGFYKTLDAIVAELKAGKFSDDLIQRARAPMIKSAETDRRGNGYWFGAIEDIQTEPRALVAIRSQINDLKTITKAEIVAAANTYLDGRRIEIRVMPKALAAGAPAKSSGLSPTPVGRDMAKGAPSQ